MALIQRHRVSSLIRGNQFGTPEDGKVALLWGASRIVQVGWGLSKTDPWPDPSGQAVILPRFGGTQYTVSMSGGAAAGGVATIVTDYVASVAGGALCGGISVVTLETATITMWGGAICGGSANAGQGYAPIAMAGGAATAGTAIVSATYGQGMSGGVVADGTATAYATVHVEFATSVSFAASHAPGPHVLTKINLASDFGLTQLFVTAESGVFFKSQFATIPSDLASSTRYRR